MRETFPSKPLWVMLKVKRVGSRKQMFTEANVIEPNKIALHDEKTE